MTLGLAVIALAGSTASTWIGVAPAAIGAVHAWARIGRPGRSPLDAVLVDTSVIVVLLAVLRPPGAMLAVAVLYLVLPAVLFLPPAEAGWSVGAVVVGVAAVRWVFPSDPVRTTEAAALAVVFVVAGVLPVGWLLVRLGDALSARRRMEHALERTTSRFEALFSRSAVPMFRSTIDGALLDANDAFTRLFAADGLERFRSEPVVLRYVRPERRSEMLDALQAHRAVRGFEARFRRFDDGEFWGRLTASLVDTPDGTVIEGVIEDVSDRRMAEHDARLTAAVFEQLGSAVVVADRDRRITGWNHRAEQMFGFSEERTPGRPSAELLRGTEPSMVGEVRARLDTAGRWQGEAEVVGVDGRPIPCAVSVAGVADETGDPAGFAMVFTDLSEIRRAEEQVRRLGELSRAVLDSVRFPVAVTADDGEIVDVNEAWTRFTLDNDGDPTRTGPGANYLDACERAASVEPAVDGVAAGIRRVLDGAAPSYSFEYPCHAPWEERWYRMEATPVPGVGAVIAHWETTAEVRARQALEEVVQAKDRFLATVSHELRTPLTAVVGFAEHLRSGSPDPDEATAYTNMIADQAREVADLVEDLLLVGRLETDTIAIRAEPLAAEEAAAAVVRPWRTAGVDVEISAGEGPTLLLADPLRVRQVLRNLVSNAVRHGTPPIRVGIRREGPLVRLDVIDAGSGVPVAALEDLYRPYTTAATLHGRPGSMGLGLFVSRRLARIMGGDLRYGRHEGRTIFTLTLPAADPV